MKHQGKVSRIQSIPGIGVDLVGDKANAMQDPEILRLENLDTDIPPPPIAIQVTQEGIKEDINNSYLPFFGQEVLRKACTKRVSQVAKREYDWRKECIITAGGMSGILNCLLATIEPGDEVIVTDPTYAGIINRIYLAGGTPIFVPLIPSPTGWRLNIEALQKAVTSKTSMVVISPGMPTGHVLTEEEWKAVSDVCIKGDLWLLYDAAMEKILYDQRKVIHPATFPQMGERTITVGAASKELRMIGWRVGWVVGPEKIMEDIRLVSISNVVCQTGISMAGVAAALNSADGTFERALKIWEERRDILMEEFKGLPVIPPDGGWSFLLDAEALGISPKALSEKLLQEVKVAATPMSGWGKTAGRYLRFVFSNEPRERLIGVGNKIKKVL